MVIFSTYSSGVFIHSLQISLFLEAFRIISFTCNMTTVMLLFNLICNSFIDQIVASENIQEINVLIKRAVTARKKLEMIQKGFSPFLFFILPITITFCIYYSYMSFFHIMKGGSISTIGTILVFVLSCFIFIYYIISFCDETCQSLIKTSNKLRWVKTSTD